MEVLITDGTKSKNKIIEIISSSKFSINIAMAYFTDREIADALLQANERGVKVVVILSSDSNNEFVFKKFEQHIEVYSSLNNGKGIMHHKFCIVDNKLLLHGSYNYTYNAKNNNQESLNVTDSFNLIKQFNQIFQELKNKLKNNNMESNMSNTPKSETNYADKFYLELKGHVQHILDFDKEKLIIEGRELSIQTNYAESGFVNKLDGILSDVQTQINKNDQTKELIKLRMKTSLDNAVNLNNQSLEKNIDLINQEVDSKNSMIFDKIDKEKLRKNEINQELNSVKLNYDIKTNDVTNIDDKIKNLDIDLITEPFWTLPRYLGVFVLFLLLTYLSFYIGSAFWKIFFESDEINKLTQAGILPENPPIFDANAILKLFVKKGFFYGVFGSVFFLIPLILTILKLFTSIPKYFVILGKVIGLVIIDIIVSLLISQHTFDLENLLFGRNEEWSVIIALTDLDFWLIFILGTIPFMVSSFVIEQLWTSYKNSKSKYVNKEKNELRKQLISNLLVKQSELIGINNQIEILNNDLKNKNEIILNYEDHILNNKEISSLKINDLKKDKEFKNQTIKEICIGFISRVDSGNVILEDVISGRILAFKEGFYEPITSTFLPEVAKVKIENLENLYENWKAQIFK
jgi:hypothetical protein